MLGDTLTVTLDGSGGTAVVAAKINQDSYGAEYLKKGTDYDIRAKVRHSKEKPGPDGVAYDRHNVEFTQTVFATADTPAFTRQVYVVIRNNPADTMTDVTNLGEALSYYLTDTILDKLFGWES